MPEDKGQRPMTEGVKGMTKEQLWEWHDRCQAYSAGIKGLLEKWWGVKTALHHSELQRCKTANDVIELQARKIRGLSTQMQQMNRGYRKKLAKLKKDPKANA